MDHRAPCDNHHIDGYCNDVGGAELYVKLVDALRRWCVEGGIANSHRHQPSPSAIDPTATINDNTMFEKLTLNDPVFNVPNYPLPSLGRGKGEGPVSPVRLLIIHCSATLPDQRVTVQDIERWHRQRGFDCIGYHFYITVDGTIWTGRPLNQVGAHCKGYNAHSIGICYEGGLDEEGRPKDTRTLLQKAALVALINKLREMYPTVDVVGHNDLDLHKACPCFSAVEEYNNP